MGNELVGQLFQGGRRYVYLLRSQKVEIMYKERELGSECMVLDGESLDLRKGDIDCWYMLDWMCWSLHALQTLAVTSSA